MNEKLYPEFNVMMVDDESHLLNSYELTLLDAGIDNILTCNDSRQVKDLLLKNKVGVLLLDLSMPHITGEELLEKIAPEHPNIQIIIITGNNELETAVRCMKNGASDYLLKPIEPSRLISSVKRAIEIINIRAENTLLKESLFNRELKNPEVFGKIITNDDKMISIFHYMEAISGTSEPILVTGETGVGKELIAKAIHELSGRTG